jgi:hypothetical protein
MSTSPDGNTSGAAGRKRSGQAQVMRVWIMIGGLIAIAVAMLAVAVLLIIAWF